MTFSASASISRSDARIAPACTMPWHNCITVAAPFLAILLRRRKRRLVRIRAARRRARAAAYAEPWLEWEEAA